jgi:hypothetical protein
MRDRKRRDRLSIRFDRAISTPELMKPVKPKLVSVSTLTWEDEPVVERPEIDADGNVIPEY